MALIPPSYLNAVVSLGTTGESFRHVGTGFLYAHLAEVVPVEMVKEAVIQEVSDAQSQ